jgi:hypothetical protein
MVLRMMKFLNYLTQFPVYYWFICSIFITGIGDILYKNLVIKQYFSLYLAVALLGIISSTVWAIIMLSSNQLIRMSFIWTILSCLLSICIGLYFKETLTTIQWAGAALALIALGLLA